MREDYDGNEELESHDESNLEIGPTKSWELVSVWEKDVEQLRSKSGAKSD